jgi:hypothetical protein
LEGREAVRTRSDRTEPPKSRRHGLPKGSPPDFRSSKVYLRRAVRPRKTARAFSWPGFLAHLWAKKCAKMINLTEKLAEKKYVLLP